MSDDGPVALVGDALVLGLAQREARVVGDLSVENTMAEVPENRGCSNPECCF